jgi:hypothetical protein
MRDLVENLRDIEENRCTYFYIVVYSFNNSIYLLYGCAFILKTKLMIGNQPIALRYYGDSWE